MPMSTRFAGSDKVGESKSVDNTAVVGIILDYQYKTIDSYDPCYKIRTRYADAVEEAGGIPIFLPHCNTTLQYLNELVDAVIISGSKCDVPPHLYNEEPYTPYLSINEEKTAFDIKVLEIIEAKKIPFLGICYGMQLLNVFFGGTMIQHIPDYITSDINHKPDNIVESEETTPMVFARATSDNIGNVKSLHYNKYEPSHIIDIKKDTILYQLADQQEKVIVNSNHHQAVKKTGTGLIASAETADGIIEAIESNTQDIYIMGIEWHPEFLKSNPLDINIFKSLVKAAKERMK